MTAPPPTTTTGRARLHTVPVTARTTWLLAEARTGWGELSDISAAAAAPLLHELSGLSGLVHGLGPADALAELDATGHAWAGASFERRTVLGGLSTALADAAAREAGMPLADWLGSADCPGPAGPLGSAPVVRRAIPLYANINRAMAARTPRAAAEVAARAVAAGFRTVKCAPFDGLAPSVRAGAGLEIARAVRDAIGPTTELLLDAHHLLAVDEVVAHAADFTALRLGWLEDAARIDDPDAMRRLRDVLAIPLAGGEFAATPDEVLPALRSGALDVLMPDVKHAGGPYQVLRLARLAAEHGVAVSLHNPSGPVATAASAHLSALLPPGPPLEIMYGEAVWRAGAVAPPEPVRSAAYTVPTSPGLGLVPSPEALRAGH